MDINFAGDYNCMYMTLISANQVSYMDAAIDKHGTLRSLFLFAGDNQETT